MVESILIVGVLTIFMIGVPMIGSMIDLKQTSIQASRYSAWEKTVNVDTNHAGDLIDERFFRNASAPISSSANSGIEANHLWGELPAAESTANANGGANSSAPTDQTTDTPLFQKARVTIVNSSNSANSWEQTDDDIAGRIYGGVANVVTTLGSVISADGWGDGDPVENGLVKSVVSTQIESNDFFTSGLTIEESTSIFIDGWSAADDETIRERVHGFVPTARLEALGSFVSRLKVIPMLGDLENLEKAFGCVKNNIVPGKSYAPVGDDSGLQTYNPSAGDDC